jgi:queuine tRNA-ribosyltransferase
MMFTAGFSFTVEAVDDAARVGTLVTPHAVVETPTFMPVGTQGSVKGLSAEEVAITGAGIVLGNTYHLWLRPGAEVVQALGGLHRFARWPRAMLTDSGGFQVFSLAGLRSIDDGGVTFRSHLDGSTRRMTPEESVRVQGLLGADIAMAFDECPPGDAHRDAIRRAMDRTTAWATRCLAIERPPGQALFGIVQGGVYEDLRHEHLQAIAAMPFDGLALGGLSVGERTEDMHRTLAAIAPVMPFGRPRYLMGVGAPRDLLVGVLAGIDMFDCVLPTRNARNGQALTWSGRVNIKQARHKYDPGPIDPRCDGPCCNGSGGIYSRGYLRHLYLAREMVALRVLSLHNVYFLMSLMRAMREAIRARRALAFARETLEAMREGDEVGPADPASRRRPVGAPRASHSAR